MADRAGWRMQVLTKHLSQSVPASSLEASVCLAYETPEANSGNSTTLEFISFLQLLAGTKKDLVEEIQHI